MPVWDADQYLKYQRERTQPAIDLAARVRLEAPRRIVDVGCGPGNSTAVLSRRWPQAELSGLDSSAEMLETARESQPAVHWFQVDISSWEPETKYDLIFSNAVLQWVPDHEAIFPRLMSFLVPGGALAVQLPMHYDSPLHYLVKEVSERPEWSEQTAEARQALGSESRLFYYDLLAPQSSELELWETEYIHIMENVEAILEWFRGTGLRPYLQALPDDRDRARFETELLERYRAAYPLQANGKVLFPFRRLFIVSYR
ncbi:trans-aconitate 2-methyltransferase [Gimesia maris]|uniref:Trans-aconitate 2-methyltransferase n=1 Tax=Gimesia maris TaxID=122 RepID=A0ABX5YMZ7_9PLAN|nr:trans-aconitate 2-methyltransferase [Gimesia maris]EDL58993.1 Trans-aconitate 2-methyltransferase [Gimesia maris DSM 8797]QEG16957.1 Trans-aconitate 2-methyltransferase [Gimesia maris]QGQ29914.1 trans-aconitate 2-methyltransferase [Gimesia maris]